MEQWENVIWTDETASEKKYAIAELNHMNALREDDDRAE
jgi:hypothetical protein